jgi:iron-sulfur cluster assembly protein
MLLFFCHVAFPIVCNFAFVMETIETLPVQFTPSALDELKRLWASQPSGSFLRVGAKGGGCSGLSYVLEFETQQEGDLYFEVDGLPCIMNPAQGIYLNGMEVHWENGLNNRGFSFVNPNASKTCGCGTSFAV